MLETGGQAHRGSGDRNTHKERRIVTGKLTGRKPRDRKTVQKRSQDVGQFVRKEPEKLTKKNAVGKKLAR